MKDIFSYYTNYAKHIDEYKKWENDAKSLSNRQNAPSALISQNSLKQKAKTISEPLLLLDSYQHEKAEDSETFFQTLNIELMSVTGILCSLPIAVTKLIPFLNKHADKSMLVKHAASALNKYKNISFNIAGKNISLPKIVSLFSLAGGAAFFINGMKNSMSSQLGLIRKASFDATQNLINDPKLFAVLTPEQEKQVESIVNYDEKHKNAFVDKLKDKVNINSSFQAVGEYKSTHADYIKRKDEYFEKQKKNQRKNLSPQEYVDAYEDKILFQNLLKNVEHDVLEPLRKVETISNISYSAMFTGGFLEYLISDKLVDILGIKNKVLGTAIKIGVPLLTYFVLNKNISDIENKAILATKYKHLKQFTEDPLHNSSFQKKKKENPIEFVKNIIKDMREYDKFSQNELPKLKAKMEAKRRINLTSKQEKEAKLLQKNTSMTINNHREKVYEQSVGIKTLSETILGPLDIAATAIGGTIGNRMSKKCANKKLAGMLTGLGAVIAFIPAAIIEAKLTRQQKLSEKIAAMLAIKDIDNVNLFAEDFALYSGSKCQKNNPAVFSEFIK